MIRGDNYKNGAPFPYLIRHELLFLILSSNLFAQTNSVARIAKPAGITNIAGPGKTTIARPVIRTVNPITIFIIRFACLSVLIILIKNLGII
jgi:hypothetical protein